MHRPARTFALIGLVIGVLTSLVRLVGLGRHDLGVARRSRTTRPTSSGGSASAPRSEPASRTTPTASRTTPTASRTTPTVAEPPADAAPEGVAAWVLPVDGACPDGYPVKVKESSGIYHMPGGGSYARTRPDRCYRESGAAEADGFRSAKR